MTLRTYHRKHPGYIPRILAPVLAEPIPWTRPIDTPETGYDFWHHAIAAAPDHEDSKENLVVVMLNSRLRPISWHRVSVGTLTECAAHPREIFRPVLLSAAHAFILYHNHPSGDPSPSRQDEILTRRMVEAASLLSITFLEHLIIGRPAPGRSPYFSFREAGIIP
jgi:DNA repair protein RadC